MKYIILTEEDFLKQKTPEQLKALCELLFVNPHTYQNVCPDCGLFLSGCQCDG